MNSNKLAIFFPGIGYTVDKPLVYYSRKIAEKQGYEIKLLPYTGFPTQVKDDADKMARSYEIALEQSRMMLQNIDLNQYQEILLVGKSIGTVVAASIAKEYNIMDRVRMVLYTPLEETFLHALGNAIVFTGTKDPWVGMENSPVPDLCAQQGIACFQIENANHSLETGHVQKDIRNMKKIMKMTKQFIELHHNQQGGNDHVFCTR